MEQHVVEYNNQNGLGDKEESFVEQGHQVGLKENRRYQGLTNFHKKMEASFKAIMIAKHPLIVEQNHKVLEQTKRAKRKPPEKNINDMVVEKKIKKEKIKEEKEQRLVKREFYVSKFTSEA
jgi:hypothetical protein